MVIISAESKTNLELRRLIRKLPVVLAMVELFSADIIGAGEPVRAVTSSWM